MSSEHLPIVRVIIPSDEQPPRYAVRIDERDLRKVFVPGNRVSWEDVAEELGREAVGRLYRNDRRADPDEPDIAYLAKPVPVDSLDNGYKWITK